MIGEALVDVVAATGPEPARALPGGSPANVAVGLARLGVPVTLLTSLGPDEYGRLVTAHLVGAGVTVREVGTGAPTSVATVTLDPAGEPGYEFSLRWEVGPVSVPAGAVAVHTGSLAAALPPGSAEVEAMLTRLDAGITVSYDPNIRPGLLTDPDTERARVERQIGHADLVKASAADLAWLYPDTDPLAAAGRWLDRRPALVVVTRGPLGSVALTGGAVASVPAMPVEVVDAVGAGDAFTAALLAGLDRAGLLGPQWPTAGIPAAVLTPLLTAANAAAALTCTRAGADPPTSSELSRALPAPPDPGGDTGGSPGSGQPARPH